MAVTAATLAAALGIAVEDAGSETDPGILEATRLLSLAGPLVDAYLRGGEAPDAIRDEAIIRTAGHLLPRRFGHEGARVKAGAVQIDLSPVSVSSVRQSGAAALLAPYVRRTA